MNKEELEKEADEYSEDTRFIDYSNYALSVNINISDEIKEAYLAGAEPREKRIAELEAQIEKMKCCNICKHYQWESCNYHSLSEKDCKANNHSLFELVGDKRK